MVRQKIIYGKKRYLAVGIFLFTLLGKYVLMETCLVVSQKSTKDGHPEPKANSKNYCFCQFSNRPWAWVIVMIYVIYARRSFHPWPVSFCWLLCFLFGFLEHLPVRMVGQAGAHLAFGGRVCGWSGGMNGVGCRFFYTKKTEQKQNQKQRLIIYYKQTHAISPFFRSSASNTTHWSHRTATSCKPL